MTVIERVSNTSQAPPLESRHLCWCGRQATRRIVRTDTFGLLQCSSCGTYQIDPRPLTPDGNGETFYTDYYAQTSGPPAERAERRYRSSQFWRAVARCPELDQPYRSALDVGCGDGRLCDELRAEGCADVLGIDLSSTRVARARVRFPEVRFEDRPLDQLGLPADAFDLVVMDAVIEHVPDPISLLTELTMYLEVNGRIVLITPNMRSGSFRFLHRRWTGMLAPHVHVFLYDEFSMRRLLERSGFDVETIGSFHQPVATVGETWHRLGKGDVKGALWRAHQDLGELYGRFRNAGQMLFAVGRKRAVTQEDAGS